MRYCVVDSLVTLLVVSVVLLVSATLVLLELELSDASLELESLMPRILTGVNEVVTELRSCSSSSSETPVMVHEKLTPEDDCVFVQTKVIIVVTSPVGLRKPKSCAVSNFPSESRCALTW